jgi:hypothetical protein
VDVVLGDRCIGLAGHVTNLGKARSTIEILKIFLVGMKNVLRGGWESYYKLLDLRKCGSWLST